MVKYMPLLERKILILRDTATSTKKEEIMTIFNNEKLHVRVKAIHDVKKADATPAMTSASASNKKSKIDTSAPLYSSGPYYANYGGYYGSAAAMDPYFGTYAGSKSPKETVVAQQKQSEKVVDDRTAISDYPGVFDKYSQETFLKIYSEMKSDALLIPQSMRGRDVRIVSEDTMVPILMQSDSEQKDEQQSRKKKKKSKRRKKRKEISGTYYEDDMYDEYGQEYDAYYGYEQNAYYGNRQRRGYYQDDYNYYEEDGYYAQRRQQQQTSPKQQQGNGGRNRAKRGRGKSQRQDGARKYNSRRNGQAKSSKNGTAKSGKVWAQKGVKSDKVTTEKVVSKQPKVQKYSTKKGVYARKVVAAN